LSKLYIEMSSGGAGGLSPRRKPLPPFGW